MLKRISIALVLLLLLGFALIYAIGWSSEYASVSQDNHIWFAALKYQTKDEGDLKPTDGVEIRWRSSRDFVLIGSPPAYWDGFAILGSDDDIAMPIMLDERYQDAYIAKVQKTDVPLWRLGGIRLMRMVGIWRTPADKIDRNFLRLDSEEYIRQDIGPNRQALEELLSRPMTYAPAMVNFLAYFDTARYRDRDEQVSGEEAYGRYGLVAARSVYSVGGHLIFAGEIIKVLRAAKAGPTRGRWDTIGIMRYPTPEAIMKMSFFEYYSEAIPDRNAGLKRTRVIATQPQ